MVLEFFFFSPLRLVGDHGKAELFCFDIQQRAVRSDAPIQRMLFVYAVAKYFQSFQIPRIPLSDGDFVLGWVAVVAELPHAVVDLQTPDGFHLFEQRDGLEALRAVINHDNWRDVQGPEEVSSLKVTLGGLRQELDSPEMLKHERNVAGDVTRVGRLQPVRKSSQLDVCRCSHVELPERFRVQEQIHHVVEVELVADKILAGRIDRGFHVDGKRILGATKACEAR